MAERRFAALAHIRRRSEEGEGEGMPPPELPVVEAAPATPPAAPPPVTPMTYAPRSQGRPPGKRSDPDWKPKTILMKTKTHRRVSTVLIERDDAPDLSELVDELLVEWLKKQ
jgi:hypothetical protein